MSFPTALTLVKAVEGTGKAGERYGMTQGTWELLGFKGDVTKASDGEIANAYWMLWDTLRLYQDGASGGLFELTPEPADSVAFQFFINVPPTIFIRAFQGALNVKPDGVLGPVTRRALTSWNGRGLELAETILVGQQWHYASGSSEFKQGLLDRVDKVRGWAAQQ